MIILIATIIILLMTEIFTIIIANDKIHENDLYIETLKLRIEMLEQQEELLERRLETWQK